MIVDSLLVEVVFGWLGFLWFCVYYVVVCWWLRVGRLGFGLRVELFVVVLYECIDLVGIDVV